MNDKIKDLAHQAGFIHDINCGHWIFNGEPVNAEVNKFAELIIKECISCCYIRVGNADYNTGRMQCVNDIEYHFGIEDE